MHRVFKTFFVLCFFLALPDFAQEPANLFEKAPPDVDEALRARVNKFYQAHVDGKFRLADQLVAEDSKDAFFAAEKPHYKSCEVAKISYSDNFKKADVVTACKNFVQFHGERVLVTMPTTSHWKIENGDWYWYYMTATEVRTPFGIMKSSPENAGDSMPPIPKDPLAAARAILQDNIKVEPTNIVINQAQSSRQELHLKNTMPGNIRISVDATGIAGLTIKPEKPELGPGEETVIIADYNFDDPGINCRECLTHPTARPPATATIRIEPTMQQIPVQITFVAGTPGK